MNIYLYIYKISLQINKKHIKQRTNIVKNRLLFQPFSLQIKINKHVMNISFWEKQTYFTDIDIAIIGSGIVGLNSAFCLKQKYPELKVIVLEKGILPTGASSKNAGFACFGSISELLDDINNRSENNVFSLVEKRWRGLNKLRKNLGDSNIDFQNNGGFELFKDKDSFNACAEKMEYLNKNLSAIIGSTEIFKIADHKISGFGFKQTPHLIENRYEGQIDTGKMIKALINKVHDSGVTILNSIDVKSVEDNGNSVEIIINDRFTITSKKVLIATNGFARQLLPELNVSPARAQVLITSPIKNLALKGTFHYDRGFYYFRNIGNRVLLGGGRNLDLKGEETTMFGLTSLIQDSLEELLKTSVIPGCKYDIEQRWSGIMGLGSSKDPIIKKISANVVCAVRLGGMGVAIGSLVGEEAADLVLS